jgi:N-acetylglutamate synthase-like GNAT family acetyltransferase
LLGSIRIRRGTKKDVLTIEKTITEWLNWEIPREKSVERAIRNKELLVAEDKDAVVGFIHYVMHEDIIDGGLNCFHYGFLRCPRIS